MARPAYKEPLERDRLGIDWEQRIADHAKLVPVPSSAIVGALLEASSRRYQQNKIRS